MLFVGSYIHHDRSGGTIIQLSVTTDFASRTSEARDGANVIAMAVHGAKADSVADALVAECRDGLTVREAMAKLSALLGEPVVLECIATVNNDGVSQSFREWNRVQQ